MKKGSISGVQGEEGEEIFHPLFLITQYFLCAVDWSYHYEIEAVSCLKSREVDYPIREGGLH